MFNTEHFTPVALSERLPSCQLQDYKNVCAIIMWMRENWRDQPSLSMISKAAGLPEEKIYQLFQRWAGLTPKAFLQALTIDHTKLLLSQSASVLDAALDAGLSGPSRLHDLFVTHEAMTPGEFKTKGSALVISYGFHPSPFGEALIMTTDRGLAGLGFVQEQWGLAGRDRALADMVQRWPKALYVESQDATAAYAARVFSRDQWMSSQPLKVILIGTDFQIRVWEALLQIPHGDVTTYSHLATQIGNAKASRAVGAAVGRNPISFVVPCHRVIGKSGALTGYHWGLNRKQVMLGWEMGAAE